MSYHFVDNEYIHLVGGKLGNVSIQNIEYSPDNAYITSDGYTGNPYLLTLSNGAIFQFRNFDEAIQKYGDFTPQNKCFSIFQICC